MLLSNFKSLLTCLFLLSSLHLFAVGEKKDLSDVSKPSFEERILSIAHPSINLRNKLWQNPMQAFYRFGDMNLNMVEANSWINDLNKAAIAQTGNHDKAFSLHTLSRLHLKKLGSCLMGSVDYEKGKTKGISWNTSGDYDLIYPYVVANPIESFMNREKYDFMGLYMHDFTNWLVGAQFKYRTELTARDRDPRPQNTMADMNISLFAGWVGQKYRLSTTANYRHYTQSSSLNWLGNLELNRYVYHMGGMGYQYNQNWMFTDRYANYLGDGYTFSFELAPKGQSGWSISSGYKYFTFDKELPLSNDIPANTLNITEYWTEVSWLLKRKFNYGFRLFAEIEDRKGKEASIETAATHLYRVDKMFDGFEKLTQHYFLSLYWGKDFSSGLLRQFALMPEVKYLSLSPKYELKESSYDISNLDAGLRVFTTFELSPRWWLRFDADGGYMLNLDKSSAFGYAYSGFEEAYNAEQFAFSLLSDPNIHYNLNLRLDFHLKNRWGLYFRTCYRSKMYNTYDSTSFIQVAFGTTF